MLPLETYSRGLAAIIKADGDVGYAWFGFNDASV